MFKYIKDHIDQFIEEEGIYSFLYSSMCLMIFTSGFIALMIFIWKLIFKQIF